MRDKITVIASGKVASGFDVVKRLALGADACNSARAMMMALGCIQALKCNTNHCPVGIATHQPYLTAGLVPSDKAARVANYHRHTLESVGEIVGAMGLADPAELKPWHVMRRTSATEIKHYGEIYEFLQPGDLLKADLPISFKRATELATADSFSHAMG